MASAGVIPDVSTTVRDGALGLVTAALNGQLTVMGVSSSGTGNTPTGIGDITTLQSTFGSGPLVELAAHCLQIGGGPVNCMRITTAATGTNSAVTKVGTGTSVAALANNPPDDADVVLKIVTGSTGPTTGIGTFQYSMDGGITYSAVTALPTTGIYVLPNGVQVTWGTGTLVAGDTYSFHDTAPAFTNTELATALDALIADSSTYFAIAVAGIPADASTFQAMFATMDTKLEGAVTNNVRYAYGYLSAPSVADSALITASAALASRRVSAPAGFENLTSAISGNQYLRPALWSVAARANASRPSEDPGRVASGPLLGVTAISRDEAKTPGVDAARYLTLQRRTGLAGFYVTQGRIMAPVGSDYSYIPNRRVMDLACAAGRQVLLQYVNESLFVDKATGAILEEDARTVEQRVGQGIRNAVVQKGDASDVTVTVDRTINLLATQSMTCKIRVLPKGYARFITMDIGLTNPALTPV